MVFQGTDPHVNEKRKSIDIYAMNINSNLKPPLNIKLVDGKKSVDRREALDEK